MPSPEKLKKGLYYHIYNRGNNGESLFYSDEDYFSFLRKYAHYCYFVLDTYAYCLLNNHFHLLVRVRTNTEQIKLKQENPFRVQDPERIDLNKIHKASRQLSHLFNSHAQSINKQYNRTGSLFEKPYHRKSVKDDNYFSRPVCYIHWNPRLHGFAKDYRTYAYSSFPLFIGDKKSRLNKQEVLDWFCGLRNFKAAHQEISQKLDSKYILEKQPEN